MDGLPSIMRQQEVAALVAQQVQGGELTQRQLALSQAREAAHRAGMVEAAEGSHASAAVGDRQQAPDEDQEQRGSGLPALAEPEAPIKDAPNPGPLGHRLDIIA